MTAGIEGLRQVLRPLWWRALTLSLGALFSTTVLAQPLEPPRGYKLVWADEFDDARGQQSLCASPRSQCRDF